jgi:hypothetical protein
VYVEICNNSCRKKNEKMDVIEHNKNGWKDRVWRIHGVEGSFAFWRQPLGKPLGVCTVIVDHIILSHPLEFLLFLRVQNILCSEVRRRSSSSEVAEGCNKGGFTPVCLDEPTSGCPIICIPKAGVYPHCLAIRIMIIVTQLCLPVLEHSNESPIYKKSK